MLQVSEIVQYVNGTNDVTVTYTVGAAADAAGVERAPLRVGVRPAGCELLRRPASSLPGPPRRVGAQALGRSGGGSDSLVEISPWSHFQEAAASTIDNVVSNTDPAAPGFNDTVLPTAANNGAGVGAQWNLGALSAGQPATVAVTWHFSRTSALELAVAAPTQTAGQTATRQGHRAQQRRQPRCRAAPSATRSRAPTRARAR